MMRVVKYIKVRKYNTKAPDFRHVYRRTGQFLRSGAFIAFGPMFTGLATLPAPIGDPMIISG